MKRLSLFLLGLSLASMALAFNGCAYDGPQYPTIYGLTPTPTATPAPPVISYGGSFNFSPASVTIKAGGSVIWDSTLGTGTASHTLYIDDGSQTSCTSSNLGYPATVTFPTAGTYVFHCSYHSGCGTACTGCTSGMVGNVVVQ